MGKTSYKLTIAAGMALFALSGASILAVSSNANAHAADAGKPTTTPAATGKPDVTGKPADAGSQGATRLADAQLKSCQKRETAINNIMARTIDRSTKQIKVFDTIATRTEAFYASKGKTLSGYSALVSAVDAAKLKATADLSAMKTTADLKCDGTDPKGAASAFKVNLKLEIADLKAYKTAVKNLIVGVKSVQGTDSSSPKASTSPTASPTTNQGGDQ